MEGITTHIGVEDIMVTIHIGVHVITARDIGVVTGA
mgnify:CR=1 FL=1